MRTYDSGGWRYCGDLRNLMRLGDQLSPDQAPAAWVNIRLTSQSVLNWFASIEEGLVP